MTMRALRAMETERLAGLVVRVSTDRQAANDEGSLKTQLQRLRQHIQYKQEAAGEEWSEVAVYELRAVSGKESVRSPEFERLFADIRAGRVNTVLCTSLDRICRSVRDFLTFFEFLSEHGVEFVCLKQNYDTTSPQGRFFVTVMMALAQFEREQTAERTREAVAARAERGLWNGGRILGYDLDPERKGYLVPNPDEVAVVNFAFDTYLSCGSMAAAAEEMNRRGYRTKAYTSRRNVVHPGREFCYTSVQHTLKNPAYIGKKVIDARGERRLVDAVWPGIVDPEKFQRAHELMGVNGRSHKNEARTVRHAHILSGGLLFCGRCQSPMQGRSGTGRLGKVYFYYACKNKDCGMRAVAPEVEGAVVDRIGVLASDPEIVKRLTEAANKRLLKQKPEIEKRLRALARMSRSTQSEAAALLSQLAGAQPAAASFINEQLEKLRKRQDEIAEGRAEAERELRDLDAAAVTTERVLDGLLNFRRVYEHLRPFEKKELIRLLLLRAQIDGRQLVMEMNGPTCEELGKRAVERNANRCSGFVEPTIWLPDEDSNLEPTG